MSNNTIRFGGKTGWSADVLIAALLAVLVLATRIPFRTRFLFNWDSVNFAFGMQQFNVTQHAPHPPGYFYYVEFARVINSRLGDANASLVLEGILFSAAAVAALYFLGSAMFSRSTGVVASLLLTTSVTFWSLGEVALSYVTLAFFSCLVALLTYKVAFEGRNLLPVLALAYSTAGGFRAELMLFLAPLFLIALYRQPWRRIILALVIALAAFLLWFGPTVWLSGGIRDYMAVFSAYTDSDVLHRYSFLYNGWKALAWSIKDTANYSFYALYATSLLLVVTIGVLITRRHQWKDRRVLLLAIWVAPILLFYTFIHIGDPGYVFSFMPGVLLVIAASLTSVSGDLKQRFHRNIVVPVLVFVLVANSAIFVFYPRVLTAPGLSQNDAAISAKLDYVKSHFAPDSVTLVSYALYKHLLYYLPQYRTSYWIDVRSPDPKDIPLPMTTLSVLLMDDDVIKPYDGSMPEERISLVPNKSVVYYIPVMKGTRLVYSGTTISLKYSSR